MDWNFSLGWLFLGLIIMAIGGAIVIFYQKIADNLASGVSSYDRTKFFGLIILAIGFLITTNLHTAFLTLLVNLLFRR